MTTITIDHQADWRLPEWEDHLESRPAWFVSCTAHPQLGKLKDGQPWGYASIGRAAGVASRHNTAKHDGQAAMA